MHSVSWFLLFEVIDSEPDPDTAGSLRYWIDIAISMGQPTIKLLEELLAFCGGESPKLRDGLERDVVIHEFALEPWFRGLPIDIMINGRNEVGGICTQHPQFWYGPVSRDIATTDQTNSPIPQLFHGTDTHEFVQQCSHRNISTIALDQLTE